MSVFDENSELVVNQSDDFEMPKRRKLVFRNEWTPALLLPLVMHPFKRGYLGWGENHYGTPTSVHRCELCNRVFRSTPARSNGYCTIPSCSSYDPNNDASWLIKGEQE